jgi:hypothetical protein
MARFLLLLSFLAPFAETLLTTPLYLHPTIHVYLINVTLGSQALSLQLSTSSSFTYVLLPSCLPCPQYQQSTRSFNSSSSMPGTATNQTSLHVVGAAYTGKTFFESLCMQTTECA